MNYRHAYHAGNHADVLKHIVLVRLIEHMKKKDKPFRVIDAHAVHGGRELRVYVRERLSAWGSPPGNRPAGSSSGYRR